MLNQYLALRPQHQRRSKNSKLRVVYHQLIKRNT